MGCFCFGVAKTPVESIQLDLPAPIRTLSINVLFDAIRVSDVILVKEICKYFAIPFPAIQFAANLESVRDSELHRLVINKLNMAYVTQDGRNLGTLTAQVKAIQRVKRT